MKIVHLSEEQLQAYAEDPAAIAATMRLHADSCPNCQDAAKAYRIAFAGLQQFKTDKFDFDLADLVLASLPAPKPELTWSALGIYFGTAAAILLVCLPVAYGVRLISGLHSLSLILMLAATFMIAVHQAILSLRNYRRKIARLEIY